MTTIQRLAVSVSLVTLPALSVSTAADRTDGKSHPLDPFLKIAGASRVSCGKLKDYTAVFRKMEVVKGKAYPSTMNMKFRTRPFSVYLEFITPHTGRKVLYVDRQNMGKMVVRQPTIGKLGVTVLVSPTGPKAMAEGRHPITKIGLANMLDAVVEQWRSDRKYPGVKVAYFPNATLKRRDTRFSPMECKVLQSMHTKRYRGIEFHMTRLFIDKRTNLPVRVEQYGFPSRPGRRPPLLAEYTYWNVNANIGLKNTDFDRKNPKYGF